MPAPTPWPCACRWGGNGLSDALLREADAVLERDELVKVRLPAGREERDRLLAGIAAACGAEVIAAIGRTGLLHRAAGRSADLALRRQPEASALPAPATTAPCGEAEDFTAVGNDDSGEGGALAGDD